MKSEIKRLSGLVPIKGSNHKVGIVMTNRQSSGTVLLKTSLGVIEIPNTLPVKAGDRVTYDSTVISKLTTSSDARTYYV